MVTKTSILGHVAAICRIDTPDMIASGIETYLADALAIYSRDRPREYAEDVTGGGANLLTVPTGWDDQFSVIRRVVYPYEDEDSTVIDPGEYEVDMIPVSAVMTPKIRFLGYSPAATKKVRVWYSKRHSSATTIYAQDETAVAHLVAYVVETAKASYFLALKDSGVSSDLVDYAAKGGEARALAKMHLAMYRTILGLKEEATSPRAAASEIDIETGYGIISPHHRHRRAGR